MAGASWYARLGDWLKGGSARPTPVEPDRPRRVALGGSGDRIYAGLPDDLDQNLEVHNELWYGGPTTIGIAAKMVRDPHVRQSITAIRAPLEAAVWDFQPASQDPIDLEIADLCRWVFFERLPWARTLRHQLFYLRDGFSLLEATDDVVSIPAARFPLHPGGGSGIVYTGFHHRPAHTVYRWWQQEEHPDRLEYVEQYLAGSDVEMAGFRPIPADRLIRSTWDQEGARFAGLAPIRSAYGAWKSKLLLMILDQIRHERHGVGTPRFTLPESIDDADLRRLEDMAAALRSHEKGYLILPHGAEFKWETTDGIGTAIGEAIERCNRDIAFNTSTGFQLLGLTGKASSSFALAQTQVGQYETQVDTHAAFIASVWNNGMDGWSPVERMVRLNYGADARCPTLIARNMPTRDYAKIIPALNNLILSGGVIPDEILEQFIRDALRLPRRDATTSRVPRTSAMRAKQETEQLDSEAGAKDVEGIESFTEEEKKR